MFCVNPNWQSGTLLIEAEVLLASIVRLLRVLQWPRQRGTAETKTTAAAEAEAIGLRRWLWQIRFLLLLPTDPFAKALNNLCLTPLRTNGARLACYTYNKVAQQQDRPGSLSRFRSTSVLCPRHQRLWYRVSSQSEHGGSGNTLEQKATG